MAMIFRQNCLREIINEKKKYSHAWKLNFIFCQKKKVKDSLAVDGEVKKKKKKKLILSDGEKLAKKPKLTQDKDKTKS